MTTHRGLGFESWVMSHAMLVIKYAKWLATVWQRKYLSVSFSIFRMKSAQQRSSAKQFYTFTPMKLSRPQSAHPMDKMGLGALGRQVQYLNLTQSPRLIYASLLPFPLCCCYCLLHANAKWLMLPHWAFVVAAFSAATAAAQGKQQRKILFVQNVGILKCE